MSWTPAVTESDWGRIQIVVNDTDVTYLRDVPTEIVSWANGEPFGDAQATLQFPQISPFDAFGSGDLDWLEPWASVEIYHVLPDGSVDRDNPLFEGMVISFDDSLDVDEYTLTVECIGALYQLDLYVRAPKHIKDTDRLRVEDWIMFQWGKDSRTHLRTQEAIIEFPDWWGTATDPNADSHMDGTKKVTGFRTADTGAWQKVMTGYIHEQIVLLQEKDATHGQLMWTIRHDAGRQPVMCLKDTTTVDWTVSLGTPGVTHRLTHDYSQAPNVIYGEGTDAAGMKWRNSYAVGGYRPVGIENEVDPSTGNTVGEPGWEDTPNPDFDPTAVRYEIHQNYGTGVSLAQAQRSAQRQIENEADPGWYGTLTLNVDPEEGSRLEIRAGQNILLKQFRGTGDTGMLLHIAECDIEFSGDQITATLTVDSKARDLLTIAELIERRAKNGQDAAKTMRVGRESGTVTDDRAPWDHHAGAGMIPIESNDMQVGEIDPATAGYRPTDDEDLYVKVIANGNTRERWGFAPVRVQEYGNISIIRLTAYDAQGNVKPCKFHVGIYASWLGGSLNVDYMPLDDSGEPNPLSEGVFDDPDNNVDSSQVILWGQFEQACGYWPGLESDGAAMTGKFKDDGGFNYRIPDGEQELWVAIYAESDEVVYFQGRMYRGND